MTDSAVKVLAFAGSLREDSYNKALIRAARLVAGDGMTVEIVELDDIPLYDADVEAEGDPPAVTEFKERIAAADALLISTPEYQHSVSGVLKNALDWASRPPGSAPITGKPAAILGATTGRYGTARAQEDLRSILSYNDCPTVMSPEVLVAGAGSKVDDSGEVVDDTTLEFIGHLLEELRQLTLLHRSKEY